MNKFQKGDYISRGELRALVKSTTPDKYFLHYGDGSTGGHEKIWIENNYSLVLSSPYTEETAVSTSQEMVAHPNHYGGDTTYEVIKVIEAWGLDNDAFLFNVIKYTARAGKKGKQLEDLKKAAFYLNRRIDSLQEAK